MIWLYFIAAVVLAFLLRKVKLRKKRKLAASPLPGYDTGVRSPWRTPVRFFKPHRGF
jgi:hypothetical protein